MPPEVPVESAPGAQTEPFHFNTCPLVAEDWAIFEGAMPPAKSASATEPSVISDDPTADLYARAPRAASCESTEERLETTLFHSEEESPDPVETVCTDCRAEYAARAADTKTTDAETPSPKRSQETRGLKRAFIAFMVGDTAESISRSARMTNAENGVRDEDAPT